MRELLEKLKDVMPSGWSLTYSPLSEWVLRENAPGCGAKQLTCLNPDGLVYNEIGLAPLTALLKQELPFYEVCTTGGGHFYARYELDQDDIGLETSLAFDGRAHREMSEAIHGGTEFEAVALAYLSLRPKEANHED